jgi:60 kDa SS-A/Ro ribonucleoprotein
VKPRKEGVELKKYLTNMLRPTPQTAPMFGTTQVRNSAGGYSWQVDQWDHLRRFLVLGSEGGSYYANEQTLTLENANNVLKCIQEDGARTVAEIVAISDGGRAPKNDPAIFALAIGAAHGDDNTRRLALEALPKVCRIGTHLFSFAQYVQSMRGWGRGLRRAVGAWYTALEDRQLAYQLVKYRQRNGWTHTDTLRLAHPKPNTDAQSAIFKWVTKRDEAEWARDFGSPENEAMAFIWAFEQAQKAQELSTLLKLISTYDLPREALPTEWLTKPEVWEALLQKMPMTAMVRNLGVMSKVGLLKAGSEAEAKVVERLTNADVLRKACIHPIAVLSALRVYALGYSLKGRGGGLAYTAMNEDRWTPTQRVIDALDTAFELAFHNVQPANKRMMLALDVSGSMAGGMIAGVAGLTPRDGAAAMAMVTARTEPQYSIISFQDKIVPLNISAKMRLDDVIKATSGLPFGATDCAQPMLYALENKLEVDAFVIYTDSETWFGKVHPMEALRQYREKTRVPARLVVVGMVSNKFTIADPNDAGAMDMVGFDAAAPGLIRDFARGEL